MDTAAGPEGMAADMAGVMPVSLWRRGLPIPVPMDPGYGGGYGGYAQAPQAYGAQPYAYSYNGGYGAAYPGQAYDPTQQHPQWSADEVNRRLQRQADRLHGRHSLQGRSLLTKPSGCKPSRPASRMP